MVILHSCIRFHTQSTNSIHRHSTRLHTSSRSHFTVRSSLPFPPQKAKYYRELEAAVDVVEKACRLCVDVKKSLFSSEGRVLEKNDQTPVTIADFGVQALISLELGRLFPLIPLVAEEDSAFLRSNNLVDTVVSAVNDKTEVGSRILTEDDVLQAIDRGGKDAFGFGPKPATYWILDPIDGTRGFLKGSEALYVVGLALIVEGEIAVGVMGCPNWQVDSTDNPRSQDLEDGLSGPGVIMVAHTGCGTWIKRLSNMICRMDGMYNSWARCSVDSCGLVSEARFCIPESQTWDSLPVSALLNSTVNVDSTCDKQLQLLPACCGSLCKYLMVASGRASIFIQQSMTQKIIKAWDHAVGIVCVHEAGGQVTDWQGSQLDLAADQSERRNIFPLGGILVTNGNLHNQILEMISAN